MKQKSWVNKKPDLVFIGDLHGQIKKLNNLLEDINFDVTNAQSLVSSTKLVFIGDLIDNAPSSDVDHVALLTKVKQLIDNGFAYCLMGNHEFNAIGWATKHPETAQWLRPHNVNNTKQHQGFLDSVIEGSEVHHYWVTWFKSLPLYLDFGGIRAIHACWQQASVDQLAQYLNKDKQLKAECFLNAFDKSTELYQLIETLLKGPEITLPVGYSFQDKTGIKRTQIRSKWWLSKAQTYRDIAQVQPEVIDDIPNIDLPVNQTPELLELPVIVGHYTLNGVPSTLSNKVACVDYNAAKEENPLVAYYWQQETELTNKHFLYKAEQVK
ncbi:MULTISPECIES: metallophosphoesterase [Colwellia]|uniref:Calcineurin-like phosphoesterase domain-containing protein n=1 Tax=Colwellia marinimaniae TaxID=1513592 RepID=A0ABQ0MZV0_9GAMM|nr:MULTISPECIES: metallophosphoesterase [Colwellia]GAW97891.1 hypothetical protein MTCD1_03540 [Colwellia marinimaniae]